ncbi:MAG: hypothetical protein COB42_00425 [Sulfurimonas sp.]|nr:MAG: hypothetical protein COB42_00425 [Sulfurimonas sp.]
MEIGSRISSAFTLKGIKSKELAEVFAISKQYVSNIKKADKMNDTISRMADHYNINLNWLVSGKGDMFIDDSNNSISQGDNSRASNRDYIENAQKGYHDSEFDDLTISLIKKCITKYSGEENFQFKLMDLLKND